MRSRFDPILEPPSNCHEWGYITYLLEPNVCNPEVKIPNWDTRIQIGVNMGFIEIHSTQLGIVLNLFTGSISPQYHIVFDDVFYTAVSIIAADPEVCKSMVILSNASIQGM